MLHNSNHKWETIKNKSLFEAVKGLFEKKSQLRRGSFKAYLTKLYSPTFKPADGKRARIEMTKPSTSDKVYFTVHLKPGQGKNYVKIGTIDLKGGSQSDVLNDITHILGKKKLTSA